MIPENVLVPVSMQVLRPVQKWFGRNRLTFSVPFLVDTHYTKIAKHKKKKTDKRGGMVVVVVVCVCVCVQSGKKG